MKEPTVIDFEQQIRALNDRGVERISEARSLEGLRHGKRTRN